MLASALPLQGAVSEPALAYWLPQLLPAQLPVMLASSSPVRDWLAWGGQAASHRRCFGFRGASGIDGTLSLAMGLALASGPLVLVNAGNGLLWTVYGAAVEDALPAPPAPTDNSLDVRADLATYCSKKTDAKQ